MTKITKLPLKKENHPLCQNPGDPVAFTDELKDGIASFASWLEYMEAFFYCKLNEEDGSRFNDRRGIVVAFLQDFQEKNRDNKDPGIRTLCAAAEQCCRQIGEAEMLFNFLNNKHADKFSTIDMMMSRVDQSCRILRSAIGIVCRDYHKENPLVKHLGPTKFFDKDPFGDKTGNQYTGCKFSTTGECLYEFGVPKDPSQKKERCKECVECVGSKTGLCLLRHESIDLTCCKGKCKLHGAVKKRNAFFNPTEKAENTIICNNQPATKTETNIFVGAFCTGGIVTCVVLGLFYLITH